MYKRQEISGVIADIRSAVVDGNTLYYLRLSGGSAYYVISAAAAPEAVIFNVGDSVTVRCSEGEGTILTADSITRTAVHDAATIDEQAENSASSGEDAA